MALAVRKSYACPSCGESFTKWGLCQGHVRASAPCRDKLGDKLHDPDELQELCRLSAAPGLPAPGLSAPGLSAPGLSAPPPGAGFLGGDVPVPDSEHESEATPARAVEAPAAAALDADAAAPAPAPAPGLGAPADGPPGAYIARKLNRALRSGLLLEAERQQLDGKLQDLVSKAPEVQRAVLGRFFSGRHADKGAWLQRCVEFFDGEELAGAPSLSSSGLSAALAAHALPPSSLPAESWVVYQALPAHVQRNVEVAVRDGDLANIWGSLADHFANICRNEEAISALGGDAVVAPGVAAEPLEWGGMRRTLYGRLLLQVAEGAGEEEAMAELARIREQLPDSPGRLLYLHANCAAARRGGPAEERSLLHAAAASGRARVCARLLAEGLDPDEHTGIQNTTPLHLAASRGAVEVVRLLLHAWPWAELPNVDPLDSEGRTPLYLAVREAARLQEQAGQAPTHQKPLRTVCGLLLAAGAASDPSASQAVEALAEESRLFDLRNLIRLHSRVRLFRQKVELDDAAAAELFSLQYETAMFVLTLFERHVSVTTTAAATEFRALIGSSFIQSRDLVQRKGNLLARRLGLSKKAIEALVDLPPAAGLHALNTWKIEEVSPCVYEVPNLRVPPPPGLQPDTTEAGKQAAFDGPEAEGPGGEESPPKLEGRIRKWDSQRGFGFIVQESRNGDNVSDIFVHRTDVTGSGLSSHLDLIENQKVTYRLGEQDGRPRAVEVTMIDEKGQTLPVHLIGSRAPDLTEASDDQELHPASRKLLSHLRSVEVQDLAWEKRGEVESWLRCVGIRRHMGGRRDEVNWKKEIDKRIDLFLERGKTPLQKRDFDFRVRRFLSELCVRSTVARVTEALAMLETAQAGKNRDHVRSWPAYLATLLRRFDPKLYEALSDRDRRIRVSQRGGGEQPGGGESDGASSADSRSSGAQTPRNGRPSGGWRGSAAYAGSAMLLQ